MKSCSFLLLLVIGISNGDYGCKNKCTKGDVQYRIETDIKKYNLKGNFSYYFDVENIAYKVRTFIGTSTNNGYCDSMDGYDGSTGPLGPCLKVNPGQTISVQLVNKIQNGMKELEDSMMTMDKWQYVQEEISGKDIPTENLTIWGGDRGKQNLIGVDKDVDYDVTNLHFHGMMVKPHLFHPVGTSNSSAPWISVGPDECYCYTLKVSEDQPCGTFMYHIHRHEVEAQQGWSGMLGVLQVGDAKTCVEERKLKNKYKVDDDQALVFWTPSINVTNQVDSMGNSIAKVAEFTENFLFSIPTVTMVNNALVPTLEFKETKVVRLRLISGSVTLMSSVQIVNEMTNEIIPMYQIADDGIMFSKTYVRDRILLSSGDRTDVLVQFPKHGKYLLKQEGIEFDFSPHNAPNTILANINVKPTLKKRHKENISQWTFPIRKKTNRIIQKNEIVRKRVVKFSATLVEGVIPSPQFAIDETPFDIDTINTNVTEEQAEEWVIITNSDVHPFHMHVNPFTIVSIRTTANFTNIANKAALEHVSKINRKIDRWNDTILLPPNAVVVIRTRFSAAFDHQVFLGKTVYHCHWMDHTDLGMMHNLEIQKRSE